MTILSHPPKGWGLKVRGIVATKGLDPISFDYAEDALQHFLENYKGVKPNEVEIYPEPSDADVHGFHTPRGAIGCICNTAASMLYIPPGNHFKFTCPMHGEQTIIGRDAGSL